MSEGYRVQLEVFSGPLDLLLYLIRRDEVDVEDIPIARIAEQYIDHVRLLEHLDPDGLADFLVMAATLTEIKSRALLPTPPIEIENESEDPRTPLVRQLLEYKRFKDAADALGHAADDRERRYVRKPTALPPELEGVELEEAEVWDLLRAFGSVMAAVGRGPGLHRVSYDDTPIELHAAELVAILEQDGPTAFDTLFEPDADRSQIVGRFLALLELIRNHRLRAEQEQMFGRIYLFLLVEEDAEPAADASADAAEESDGAPTDPEASEASDDPTE